MDFSKKRKTGENGDADSSPPIPQQLLQQQQLPSSAATTTLTPEDIRKILQPFTQEQLLDLLQSASLRHPDVLENVRSVADRDSSLRKIFVRGLAGQTTSDTLRAVFSAFGDIDEAIVIFDKHTGKSKGYGFVTFSHIDGAVLALKEPSKKIDGRMTVAQLASAGGPGAAAVSDNLAARKVFVGNVPFEISSERLLSHFLAYGEVEEGPLGFDQSSGKTKGFAFFVYKTEEGARACLAEPTKTIDGCNVFCKLAVDGKKAKAQNPASGFAGDGMHVQQLQQQQQQQPPSYTAPSLISQYGAGGGHGNGYGMQSSVPSYGNPIPAGGGYGQPIGGGGGYGQPIGGGGGYGSSQFGGPFSGDYGTRVPPNSGGMPSGGYMDGSRYKGLPSSALPTQQPPPPVMPGPAPPGGIYQGMPPYY